MTPNHPISQLDQIGCQYSFYYSPRPGANAPGQGQSVFLANQERFASASMIKIPILLAWVYLERAGEVSRDELCSLDDEPQVHGSGFSWLLSARKLPYQDVLLLMIALSDNLCTNLVIRRAGMQRLNQVFQEQLGLHGTQLQRKMMDFEARARGLENWITAQDCIRFYACIEALSPAEREWVKALLAANQDNLLLMRSIPPDSITFYHKTGTLSGVLHDWGFTDTCRIFLLTQGIKNPLAALETFGALGQWMLPGSSNPTG